MGSHVVSYLRYHGLSRSVVLMFFAFCSSCNAASFPVCMFLFFSLSSGIWRLRSFGLSNHNQGKGLGKGRNMGSIRSGKRNFGSFGRAALSNFTLLLLCFFAKQQTTKPASLNLCDHLNNKKLSFPNSRFSCRFSSICFAGYTHGRGASLLFLS